MKGEFQEIVATLMRTLLEEHPTLLEEKEIDSLKDVVGLTSLTTRSCVIETKGT